VLTISQLARQFGLSRSTLLYYDSIGLLSPSGRSHANYRLYSEDDVRRMESIARYRSAGLSLADIARILDSGGNRLTELLEARLGALNDEIRGLRLQQKLIVRLLRHRDDLPATRHLDKAGWVAILRASGMTDDDMSRWHVEFERHSPEAHQDFLESLGIEHEEIDRIRRWSRSTDGGSSEEV
jgi:DNA-binding transcriptional MerR regulator